MVVVDVDVEVDDEGEIIGRGCLNPFVDTLDEVGVRVEYGRFLSEGAKDGGEEDRYELEVDVDWKGDCGGCGVIVNGW